MSVHTSMLNRGDIAVPAADSSDNNTFRDVVGNKNDGHTGDSVYSIAHRIEEHVHKESKVYPTLAAGVTVTSSATAWVLGSFATVVAASTITSDFDIHYISIESISANGVYELVLYYGVSDTECGRVRFTKNTNQDGTMNIPMMTPIIPANSQIRAKVASSNAVADTVDISIFYHTY